MKRNSVFAVAREALRQHSGWGRTWGNPEAKKAYDVVIIGAGGHGLAAEEMIDRGMVEGNWVLLQNCHLFKSWMPRLETKCIELG